MQSCLITLPGDFTCRFALGEGGLKTDDSHVCHTYLQRAVSFSKVVAKLDNNSLPLLQCFFFLHISHILWHLNFVFNFYPKKAEREASFQFEDEEIEA